MLGPLTLPLVNKHFSAVTMRRGRHYWRQRRVLKQELIEHTPRKLVIGGRVLGNEIYQVGVVVETAAQGTRLRSDCSCPVGRQCKHAVALCLHLLHQQADQPAPSQHEARLRQWLHELRPQAESGHAPKASAKQPYYLLDASTVGSRSNLRQNLHIEVVASRPKKNGEGFVKPIQIHAHQLKSSWSDIQTLDADQLPLGLLMMGSDPYFAIRAELNESSGQRLLDAVLATGRAFWRNLNGRPLRQGSPRRLHSHWDIAQGTWTLHHEVDPPADILLGPLALYHDPSTGEIGPITGLGKLSPAQWLAMQHAPPVPEALARDFSVELRTALPELDLATPTEIELRKICGQSPRPCLRLGRATEPPGHVATLQFEYAGERVAANYGGGTTTLRRDQTLVQIEHDIATEQAAQAQLQDLGFAATAQGYRPDYNNALQAMLAWHQLLEQRESLEQQGWRIDQDKDFDLGFVEADWEAEVTEGQHWFDLRFDLEIDGERLPLAPLLAPLIEDWLDIPDSEWPPQLPLSLDDGRHVLLESERLRPILKLLHELFAVAGSAADLRVPRSQAALLAEWDQQRALGGAAELRQLLAEIRNIEEIESVAPPSHLQATLRPYQQQGLNWLQFLRRTRFNGILADDMGLGKTVQTLAHLLLEKQSGRLTQPTLLVCPTSLLGNWRRETERFAPAMRLLTLHGKDRQQHFASLAEYDIVLSTYPLVSRDAAVLKAQAWQFVILDEAQQVKNPRSQAARTLRELSSQHRLCLTGTPMENHLGDLWTQFDFLMPGLLGDAGRFRQRFRQPIENQADPEASQQLAGLVRPFLLRRTKSEVATELPPRTDIQDSVTLGKAQAELYESVRVAMDRKVREAIARQGLERSHITILDALLKLRQVCCDPRLVKLAAAQKVHQSAKLERLLVILPELLEEGRRVLLFSQFTQMLALIEPELQQRGIGYAKLTGQTRKRDEAIQRFRSGEVPLFLISLKAGGVGLNLTEADTVILYDPWWNPAVEEQAADRTHRIGQDKPVFVHRLVVENSVEEKMLQLQQKKKALANGLYSATRQSVNNLSPFDPDALQELLAPVIE